MNMQQIHGFCVFAAAPYRSNVGSFEPLAWYAVKNDGSGRGHENPNLAEHKQEDLHIGSFPTQEAAYAATFEHADKFLKALAV